MSEDDFAGSGDLPPSDDSDALPADALPLPCDVASLRGRWIEIVYDVSMLAPLRRPMLLWRGDAGAQSFAFAPAPVYGRGRWIGRAPDFVREGWFCSGSANPERVRIVSAKPLGRLRLLSRGWAARPGLTLLALRALASGDRARARKRMEAALAAWPPGRARRWAAARSRVFDPEALDRVDPQAPALRLLAADPAARWIVRLRADDCGFSVRAFAPGDDLLSAIADLPDEALVIAPPSRLELAPEAVACWREAGRGDSAALIYADEADARTAAPRLRPDWSPVLAQSLDLLALAAFRAGWARERLRGATAPLGPLRPLERDRVAHLRRVLGFGTADAAPPVAALAPAAPPRIAGAAQATIIIPTRDRVDLLERCVATLPRRADLEIVVVDNGSVAPATLAFLEATRKAGRIATLRDDGDFNFSRLCNAGAAAARGATLIFLNDDVEARDETWLDLLTGWAAQPRIGAVGAKLLYPDGRVQHGGVTLGMGGRAGHAERGCAADAAGFFGRLNVPHEVSAVTAACLAVEARKFAAVGGFDASGLPVDLNDVDLCLRLARRGWRSLMEPRARLIHRESATRGDIAGETRYAAEIACFRRRWRREIGDDPYFHPALSLSLTTPSLG